MRYSERVKLIAESFTRDAAGNLRTEEQAREVWADVRSVSRAEFAAAGAQGIKPTAAIAVHETDYAGEELVEAAGRRLRVYRSFWRGDEIELYVSEKRGDRNEH